MFNREFHFSFTLAQVGKLVFLSPLVILPSLVLISLPWSSASAPPWVQAVGSVVAIFVAILIARHQHKSEDSRLKARERQRDIGLATRLHLFALEYHSYVTNVVAPEWQVGLDVVDQRNALVFDRLLMRLTSNFDDDLDQARCVQVFVLKTALTGLIFTLQSTNAIDQGGTREGEIRQYQSNASRILGECKALLDHANKI